MPLRAIRHHPNWQELAEWGAVLALNWQSTVHGWNCGTSPCATLACCVSRAEPANRQASRGQRAEQRRAAGEGGRQSGCRSVSSRSHPLPSLRSHRGERQSDWDRCVAHRVGLCRSCPLALGSGDSHHSRYARLFLVTRSSFSLAQVRHASSDPRNKSAVS